MLKKTDELKEVEVCKHCGEPLPDHKKRPRQFCSFAHRAQHAESGKWGV
jgi:hypothetical protein